jgi:hypothetical protein
MAIKSAILTSLFLLLPTGAIASKALWRNRVPLG